MRSILLLPLVLGLGACAAGTTQRPAGPVTDARPTSTPSCSATAGAVLAVETPYPGCYYVPATRELPLLSQRLAANLRSPEAVALASAYAYGEDCVAADGSRTFSRMETDFRTRIRVGSLVGEESLGNWIAKVMNAIEGLPAEEVEGPHLGRVEFEFFTAQGESLRFNVQIAQYRHEGAGYGGARLFRLFYRSP